MNLKELIQAPNVRTFKFRADEIAGVEVMEDGDGDDKPILELDIEYANPRRYREMLTDAIDLDRKAVTRKGIKAITVNEDKARRLICRRLIKGWRMTVAGAYALELARELSGMDPSREIDFNEENLAVMIEDSQLPAVLNELMTNHQRWFDAPESESESDNGDGEPKEDSDTDPLEDSSKNSERGANGSSGD